VGFPALTARVKAVVLGGVGFPALTARVKAVALGGVGPRPERSEDGGDPGETAAAGPFPCVHRRAPATWQP
jgi:hypothetical protein